MKDDNKDRTRVSEVPEARPAMGVVFTLSEHVEDQLRGYEKLVEGLEEMIAVVDREYRYLMANRAYLKQRCIGREQVVGCLVPEVLGKDLFERVVKPKLDECFEGKVVSFQMTCPYPEIGDRVLSISYLPIEGPDRVDRIACVLHDVTERKQAEDVLRQSEQQLAEAQRIAQIGSFSWDLRTNSRIWSEELYRIFGIDRDKSAPSLAAALVEFVHPNDRELVSKAIQTSIDTTQPCSFFYRIIRPDGEVRRIHGQGNVAIDDSGNPIRLFGTAQDITDRRRTEDALRNAERKYRGIFENAGEGIFQTTPEGRYLEANPALARMHGFDSPEELISGPSDISHEVYVDPSRREEFKRLIESQGSVRGFEHQIFRRDGSKIWISVNARAVRDERGQILYYEGTTQDINERKLAATRSAAFATLARKLSGASTKQAAARIIAETASELFGWDSCDLDVYDADRDLLRSMLLVDTVNRQRVDVTGLCSDRKPTPRSRRVIDHGPELILRENPIQFDQDTIPFGDTQKPSASIMSVPVLLASKVVGILSIQSYTPRAYDAESLNHLQALADHCGEALNRIQAEEAFYESEERFRQMAEHFEDVIWLTNKDLTKVLYLNPAYERIFRRTCDSVYEQLTSFLQAVHPEDRAGVERLLEKQRKGQHEPIEYRIVWPDGSVRWIHRRSLPIRNTEGEIYLVAGIAQDITKRKRAQEALRESEERFRQLSEAPFEAIILHDQGTILEVNQSFCRMYRYEAAEVIGKSVLDLTLPGFRAALLERVRSGNPGSFDGPALRKDGTVFAAQMAAKPIQYQGRAIRVAAIRDITEQKRNARRQAAQYAVTRVLAESATLAEAAPQLLQVICESLRWKMGEFWRVADLKDHLRCVETWHVPTLGATSFITASCQTELARGADLPGRVWQNGRPEWISELPADPCFERAEIATSIGLRGAVAFPILLGSQTLGVMQFFSSRVPEVDEDLLKILSAIGSQIGQFIEHRRAEAALKQSEQDFRRLFEQAHDAILVLNPEHEIVLDVNERACELYGFPRSEFIGMSLETISKDVARGRKEISKTLERGDYLNFETVQYRKDGTEMFLEINASTTIFQGQVVILSINRDVTERKQAEEALRESEERYRDLVENSRELICTQTLDGTILSANRAAVEVLGYDPKDYEGGKSFRDLLVPEFRDQFDDYLTRIRHEGFASGLTMVQTSSGERRLLEYHNTVRTEGVATPIVRGMGNDITERWEAERALKVSEQKYRDIFSFAPVGICQTLRDGTVITANAALAKMLGYETVEELLERKLDNDIYFVPGEREKVITSYEQQGYTLDLELQWKRKDGSPIWIQLNAHTIKERGGASEYYEGFVLDITERKRSEESLRKHNDYLAALHETALGLINRLDLDELLEDIVRRACALVDVPNGFVYLIEPSGTEMCVRVGVGVSRAFVGSLITVGEGLAGRIWQTGQSLVIDDYRNWEHRLPNPGFDVLRTVGAVPLRSGSRVVGVLGVESTENIKGLGEHQIEILDRFAQLASIALDNAHLHSSMQRELTERKRAENETSNMRRELELTMNSMEEGVQRVDLNGDIVFENPAGARMLGWPVAELLGKAGHETMHHTRPDGTPYPKEECPIYMTFRDGLTRHVADEVFWRRDGTSFPVEYTLAPMRNDQDEIIGVVATFRDITERKWVEDALRESESFRRTIVESEPECVKIVALDYTLLDMNPAGLLMFGADSRERVLGQSVLSLIAPEHHDAYRELHSAVFRGESRSAEYEIVALNGQRRWLDTHAAPLRNKDSTVIAHLAITRDITERKRAEESLKLFRKLIDQSSDAIEVIDPQTFRFLDCNANAYRALGYTREEFLSLTVFDVDPLVTLDSMAQLVEGMDEKAFVTLESLHRRKDGTTFPVEVNVKMVKLERLYRLAVVRDISSRKRAEQALRESEERYRELFENAKDAIYVHDLSGRYVSVNRAAEQLSGYPRAEILGKHFSNFVSPRHLKQVRTNLCKKLDEENETIYEVSMITRDRQAVPVEVSSRLIYENGVAVGVQGVARDITDRKRAQEALRTYSRRVIEAQEAERQHIARELHDEIGQVLTAVKINLQSLKHLNPASAWMPPLDESIGIVDEALGQVRELSIQLRPALLDDLGLTAALRWYVDRYAQRTGIRAEVMNGFEDGGRLSRELETACFRIAQEALTNVARHANARSVSVQLERCRERVLLTITDDGTGFDVKNLLRNAPAAATLGLHGMEERALALSGNIEIESASQKGTRIRATLPLKRKS